MHARQITAPLLVSLTFRPSMAINIFHQCQVRSQPFAAIGRFLAGWFTFLSWRPTVNWLRASGRNWFRIIMTMEKKSWVFCTVFCNIMLSCEMWSVPHANERHKTSNLAGNWGRQMNYHWPHSISPTLARQTWYVLTIDFTPQHHRDRDWVRAKLPKTFN